MHNECANLSSNKNRYHIFLSKEQNAGRRVGGYDYDCHLKVLWDCDSMSEMLQEKQTVGNEATKGLCTH